MSINLSDIPHELLPLMFDIYPKLQIISTKFPNKDDVEWHNSFFEEFFKDFFYDITIEDQIKYVSHFVGFERKVTGTTSQKLAIFLRNKIDDFMNDINNNAPSELKLIYREKTNFKPFHIENPKPIILSNEFINIPRTMYETSNNTIISYNGSYYIFNNIVLGKDAHTFVCDLLKFMKSALYFPDHVDYLEKSE